MGTNEVLAKWAALETGDGLNVARRVSRNLSIAAFVLCVVIGMAAIWLWVPAIAFAIAGAIAGWMIAERNALNARISMWPFYRQYLDWTRVNADLDKTTVNNPR